MLLLDVRPGADQIGRLKAAFDCVETAPLYGDRPGRKLHRVQRVTGARPMAWLTADPTSDAYRWAGRRAKRGTPTLLLRAHTDVGATEQSVDTLLRWGRRVMCGSGETLDIGSTAEGPAGALSNFTEHPFVFRGAHVASMEGLLQSLKCPIPDRQAELWRLSGSRARKAGAALPWRAQQTLYWQGEPLDRHGAAYQDLMDEAYSATFDQNQVAREALLATGSLMLDHSMGKIDPHDTVLTVDEFCSRLKRLREELAGRARVFPP